MCVACGARRPSRAAGLNSDLCDPCFDYAGWENAHSDQGHDALPAVHPDRDACLVCIGSNPAEDIVVGHTDTVAKTYTRHADHLHLATPRDRERCRASVTVTGVYYRNLDAYPMDLPVKKSRPRAPKGK
jgi:hypothetical protein